MISNNKEGHSLQYRVYDTMRWILCFTPGWMFDTCCAQRVLHYVFLWQCLHWLWLWHKLAALLVLCIWSLNKTADEWIIFLAVFYNFVMSQLDTWYQCIALGRSETSRCNCTVLWYSTCWWLLVDCVVSVFKVLLLTRTWYTQTLLNLVAYKGTVDSSSHTGIGSVVFCQT